MSDRDQRTSLWAGARSSKTLIDSLVRLNPVSLIANPVMFIVEITFFIVAAMAIYPQGFVPVASPSERIFYVEVAAILLVTVWFSTLSDSLAETQAKSTANSLRKLETESITKKLVIQVKGEGESVQEERAVVPTPSTQLRRGDMIMLEKGDLVPIDAEVTEGIAMVDESLLTGESTPVRKAPSDPLIGGSKLISDTLIARVTVNPEDSYINQMIRLVESSKRPKTPNEQAVIVVLIGLTAIFTGTGTGAPRLAGCGRGAAQSHACGDFGAQPVCTRCLDGPGGRRDLALPDSRGRAPCGRTPSRNGSRPARAPAKPSIRRRGSPNPLLLPHQELHVTRRGAASGSSLRSAWRTSTRILPTRAAFHFLFATRKLAWISHQSWRRLGGGGAEAPPFPNLGEKFRLVTQPEFGKNLGGTQTARATATWSTCCASLLIRRGRALPTLSQGAKTTGQW